MSPCERCGGDGVRDVVSRGGETIGIQCATCNAPLGKRKLRRLYDLHGSWPGVARALGVGHRALYAHAQAQEGRETMARLRAEVTRLRAMVVDLGGTP